MSVLEKETTEGVLATGGKSSNPEYQDCPSDDDEYANCISGLNLTYIIFEKKVLRIRILQLNGETRDFFQINIQLKMRKLPGV